MPLPRPRESSLESLFDLHCKQFKLPKFEKEHRFHPSRKWRFDRALPDLKIAVELEGGIFNGGRHTRGNGFQADCEKYNTAAILGWTVLRFTAKMLKEAQDMDVMQTILPMIRK